MKIRRRILVVCLCAFLVFSFSVAVYASASKTFFTVIRNGYSCTGQGKIVDNTATAYFKGTPKLMEQIIPQEACHTQPQEACTSQAVVQVYDIYGVYIGSANTLNESSVTATATYTAGRDISYTTSFFVFNGDFFGFYRLDKK